MAGFLGNFENARTIVPVVPLKTVELQEMASSGMDGEGGMVNECRWRFDSNSAKLSGRKMRSWPRYTLYYIGLH